MTSRGRVSSTSEWDEFNGTARSCQYPEDESEDIPLDYTKLYVTKLPVALGKEGFLDLFSKHGNVVHLYMSRDPVKRYAFVAYETTGEARVAISKLHRTEPFCMSVCFAHLRKVNASSNSEQPSRQHSSMHHSVSNTDRHQSVANLKRHSSNERHSIDKHSSIDKQSSSMGKHSSVEKHSSMDRSSQKVREDSSMSSQSKPRNAEDHLNGEEMDGTEGSDAGIDPKFEYDLEQIKLERLQVKEQQLIAQERLLIQRQKMKITSNSASAVTKRRLLPDGHSVRVTQDETSFTVGAGDSNNIPGLQREASQRCVGCGASAKQYCAGCHVTPYCGERCQRRDWEARHGALCHNLSRSTGINVPNAKSEAPRPASRPTQSPVIARAAGSGAKENGAATHSAINHYRATQRIQERINKSQPHPNQSGSQDERTDNQFGSPNGNSTGVRNLQQVPRPPLRQPARGKPADATNDIPVATKPAEAIKPIEAARPVEATKLVEATKTVKATKPVEAAKPVEATKPIEATKPFEATKADATKSIVKAKPEVPKSEPLKAVSLASVTPRKPLVPSSFILQTLEVGTICAVNVVGPTTELASEQSGFVCMTISQDVVDVYELLFDEFSLQCEKENEGYKPRIGETFSYFCKDESTWYRARCLAPTRGALLDVGRLVSFDPSVSRKLPSSFAAVPEFVAVVKMEGLQIGAVLTATVVSTSALSVRMKLIDDESKDVLGEADAAKWATIVEYPQEPVEPETIPSEPEPGKPPRMLREPVKDAHEEVKPVVKTIEPQAVAPKPVIRKPLVPGSYVGEYLKVGDKVPFEIGFFDEAEGGFVCLAIHVDTTDDYARICYEFPLKCTEDSVEYTPAIGETFALFNKEDEGWYRARCLAPARACLLDIPMVTSFEPSICRVLPCGYADIPEFVIVIKTENLEAGANLDAEVVTRSPTETKVRIDGIDGEHLVKRWNPPMEYPSEPSANAATPAISTATSLPITSAATSKVPTLLRPCVEHNALYILCSMTSLNRACVRPVGAQELFDKALHDTVRYGFEATPLTEPAQKGQIVVAKFSEDGLWYRALVKRVHVAKNKYLIEYVEYGNEEIVKLDCLYPCPSKLSLEAMPPQASLVRLSDDEVTPLTPAAIAYIDTLKDNEELVLTIPGGAKSKASGCLVNLVVARNCEPASQKIENLCLQKLFYKDVLSRFTPFRTKGGPVTLVLPYCDANLLANGNFAGYEKDDENAPKIFGELSQKLQEYGDRCGKTPYKPEGEELCVARNCRVNNKWDRAVVVELDEAGAKDPQLMFLDHGNLEDVAAENILKILPEHIEQYPICTRQFSIKDFPVETVTDAQVVRAMRLMEVTPSGRGELVVRAVQALRDDTYEVQAPELLQALTE